MFAVFDLDGTIANVEHRVHYVSNGRRDYDKFFAECVNDTPNWPVIHSLNALYDAGAKVEIWSARSDVVRAETVRWLAMNHIDPMLLVHMRADGDMTRDVELKRHWLHALHPDERPDVIFDDRQSVVNMWRDEETTCFQVAANWEDKERVIEPVCDPLLTIMVGPSGGGKSRWCERNASGAEYVSSDLLRGEFTGDFRDQSRNEDVFYALHKIAKTRLECGLPVTIDATNLRRKDRLACVACAPEGVGVRYVVINRPMAEKVATAGWRAGVMLGDNSLLEAHEQRFNSQLKDILAGDGLPQVSVLDLRKSVERVAA